MTVVLDTNVLVAALVAEGLCREVVHRALRMRGVATSRPLLDELDATLRRTFTVTPGADVLLHAEVPVYRQNTSNAVLHLRDRADVVADQLRRKAPVDALVEQDPHEAAAMIWRDAASRKAMTCSRDADGNPSRNWSMVSPPSR